MDNLPVLLPNATPLVSRFFAEMSKKRQFLNNGVVINLEKSFRFRQSLRTLTIIIVSIDYPRISGKVGFTIGDKALMINN
jgi:hypothetical protein